ncbi:hypothetical protein A6D6_02791 [Alcanivorax xiamenensis]|uniref:Uncharacterized protein n=1 Tax=Alcanivorax xiamenensis TaxID=1177156 RepID=A0ABQ6Y607_9GAMM|nr:MULTISPECIES: hypothetical protein [Alcanivorax]KAF0804757.1 hypothetical protein A6D6_02791 [Alcanivorax xiamenensis]
MSKVMRLEEHDPETALENLNRLTGLDFHCWPESLLEQDRKPPRPRQPREAGSKSRRTAGGAA